MTQLKQKLILLFTVSSLLATSFLSTTINNKSYQSNNSKIGGFHITVKSSNRNLVNSVKSWNNDSDYLYNNANAKPLNINFNSYDQIISNNWNSANNESKDVINSDVYNELTHRIKDNITNFKNAQGFQAGTAFGHSFNAKTNNLILQYNQQINESNSGGIFKTIYDASKVNTLDFLQTIK